MKLRHINLFLLAALAALPALAQTVPDLLFKGVANVQGLSAADRHAIAALLPIAVGPEGLVDSECKQASYPSVTLRDLNQDGRTEVIVIEGNSCAYGMMGKLTHILASDSQGRWRTVISADGDEVHVRPAKPGAWPEIMPAVRGFCYPIWGYAEAQRKYVLKARVADPKMPDACKGL
jgi:hypothetical protein